MKEQEKKETKKTLLAILSIFLTTRIAIVIISYLSTLVIKPGRYFSEFPEPNSIMNLFFKWDSQWYMDIIYNGYVYVPGQESSIGFFPLYPMLVKLASFVFGNPKLMGFLISNVALFLACIYMYKLVKLDYKDKKEDIALKSVFYMLIFPLTFFFSIFYTEGLFMFLVISCFYYARKKQWMIAGILGFFLSLTRSLGVFVFIPILVEYLDIDYPFKIKKKVKKDVLWLLLIPAGLLSFMLYCYIKFGSFLTYFHSKAAWGNQFSSVFTTLGTITRYGLFYKIIFLSSIILTLIIIIYLIYSGARFSYVVYCLLFLYLYLSAGILEGIPRYISILFPLYLGIALASRKKYLEYIFVLFSMMLLTLFLILFVNGYWFN